MEFELLSENLFESKEIEFNYNEHFIYIQERVDGGFEGDIYTSEEDYNNGLDCLDGGICESILPCVAVGFFREIADDLTKRGL